MCQNEMILLQSYKQLFSPIIWRAHITRLKAGRAINNSSSFRARIYDRT